MKKSFSSHAFLFAIIIIGIGPVQAQAGWLAKLFGENNCESEATTDVINFSVCAGSVSDFSEDAKLPYPEYKIPVIEPSTGMHLTRITDNPSKGKSGIKLSHQYSKRQAWNLDETMIDMGAQILSADSYDPVLDSEPMSSARNWSNVNPQQMIGIRYNPEPNSLTSFDFQTHTYNELRKFNEYTKCSLGRGEGSLSNDDARVVLTCDSKETGQLTIIAYDLKEDKILGVLEAKDNFNWASFSQTGKYIVLENNHHPDPSPELLRYSANLTDPILLSSNPAHGDLAITAGGNDMYVMIYSNAIETVRLHDRHRVTLPIGGNFIRASSIGSGHVSCKATERPGWCYLSTYTGQRLGAVLLEENISSPSEELFSTSTSPDEGPNAYEHWGYHRSTINSYTVLAKATVSRSGRKILFTSDWYGAHTPNDYVLELPLYPDRASLTSKSVNFSDKYMCSR